MRIYLIDYIICEYIMSITSHLVHIIDHILSSTSYTDTSSHADIYYRIYHMLMHLIDRSQHMRIHHMRVHHHMRIQHIDHILSITYCRLQHMRIHHMRVHLIEYTICGCDLCEYNTTIATHADTSYASTSYESISYRLHIIIEIDQNHS